MQPIVPARVHLGQTHNPFSSHLVEPAGGGYIFRHPCAFRDLDEVLETLRLHQYRGHLLGPHGAGKSTLLQDVQNRLASSGLTVTRWQSNDRRRSIPALWLSDIRRSDIIFLDGAERLYPGLLTLVRLLTRYHGCGLVVTTHRPLHLGAAIPVNPNPEALAVKIAALTAAYATPLAADNLVSQLAAHLQQHQGNAREVLFDFYLRHEQLGIEGEATSSTSSTG